jgi:hypothetical protein
MAIYGVITQLANGPMEVEIYQNEPDARTYANAQAMKGLTATVVLGVARYVPQPRQVTVNELS